MLRRLAFALLCVLPSPTFAADPLVPQIHPVTVKCVYLALSNRWVCRSGYVEHHENWYSGKTWAVKYWLPVGRDIIGAVRGVEVEGFGGIHEVKGIAKGFDAATQQWWIKCEYRVEGNQNPFNRKDAFIKARCEIDATKP